MLEANLNNFESLVLNSEVPVVVDFWATWCPPCQMLTPIVEQLDAESNGRYRIVKVDVDQQRQLAINYNVTALPTLKFFHQGEVVRTLVGLHSADSILNALPRTEPVKS